MPDQSVSSGHQAAHHARELFCQCKLLLRPSPDLSQFSNGRGHHAGHREPRNSTPVRQSLQPSSPKLGSPLA
ncbi:hypothetical protein AAFF_G00437110 [Aldrovandia affinis]|uniref:Uncharacterized protein n=1 Tax=Aldrovandia affinis TaxID=143900 RepID=A0AAD7R3G5_9TELE|nr:hypothetical protein AAFF_G00437110 [Aldrovandia affinis]